MDDIKSIQENAMVQRLSMQVDLILDIEKRMPMWMRRRLLVRGEAIEPNKKKGNWVLKVLRDDHALQIIVKATLTGKSQVSASLNETKFVGPGM